MRKRFPLVYGHFPSLSRERTFWREFSIIIRSWRDGGALRGKRFLFRSRMASWTCLFLAQKNRLRFAVAGKRGASDARRRTFEPTRCQASSATRRHRPFGVHRPGSRPRVRYLPIFRAYPNNRVERGCSVLAGRSRSKEADVSKATRQRRDATQPPAARRFGAPRGRLRRCSSSTYQVDAPSSLRLASDPSTLPTRPARLFGSALIQRQKLSQSPKRTKLSR